MLTITQSFFLKILADHLHDRNTINQPGVDWVELYDIAKKHQLSAVVYYQCKDFIPKEYISNYKALYFSTLKAYSFREEIIDNVSCSLKNNGIEYATIKGPNIARYYPVPALRTMGDIDFIVKKKTCAEPHILSCGFERREDKSTPEWKYFLDEFEIELHNNLIEVPVDSVEDDYKDYFNDTWNHMTGDGLEDNYHFVLMVRHMRKHVIGSGVGFRLFFDIAVEIKNNNNLDFEKILSDLKTVTMKPFALKCFNLCRRWFELELPFECPEVSEEFYAETTNNIFKNGIFGFGNESNHKAFVVNRLMDKKHPRLSMIKRALNFAFPPYSVIKDKYPIVNNKPYLLPFAWIYRFFDSILKGKGRQGKENIKDSFSSKKKISSRKELYNKWSL